MPAFVAVTTILCCGETVECGIVPCACFGKLFTVANRIVRLLCQKLCVAFEKNVTDYLHFYIYIRRFVCLFRE